MNWSIWLDILNKEIERQGLTQTEITNRVKIPYSTLNGILLGKKCPRIDTVGLILKALNLKFAWMERQAAKHQ